jgi:hypothetical protein
VAKGKTTAVSTHFIAAGRVGSREDVVVQPTGRRRARGATEASLWHVAHSAGGKARLQWLIDGPRSV